MLLYNINDNIIIYHQSKLGVYHNEAKIRALLNIPLGCNHTKKTEKTAVHVIRVINNI